MGVGTEETGGKFLAMICHIDRSCVCFISAYTALYDLNLPTLPILFVAILGGLGHERNTKIVVGISFFCSLRRIVGLPLSHIALYFWGTIVGAVLGGYGPNGEWPMPFRFVWHTACAAVFAFGGIMNRPSFRTDHV